MQLAVRPTQMQAPDKNAVGQTGDPSIEQNKAGPDNPRCKASPSECWVSSCMAQRHCRLL